MDSRYRGHICSSIRKAYFSAWTCGKWQRGYESNAPPDSDCRDNGFENRGGHQALITLQSVRGDDSTHIRTRQGI